MSGAVVALATVEGRKLIRHPAFLAGVGLGAAGTAMFVSAVARGPAVWDEDGWMIGVGFLMLALLTMVATNLAALRDRRADAVEQHEALPVARDARTGGLLLGMCWPAAVAAILAGLVLAYASTATDLDRSDLLLPLGLAATVLALGALGVALARWFPSAFVAPLVAWGLLFVNPGDDPSRWFALSPLVLPSTGWLIAWHAVYLAGLASLFATLALVRDRSRAPALVVGLAGLAVTVVAAWVLVSDACPAVGPCRL